MTQQDLVVASTDVDLSGIIVIVSASGDQWHDTSAQSAELHSALTSQVIIVTSPVETLSFNDFFDPPTGNPFQPMGAAEGEKDHELLRDLQGYFAALRRREAPASHLVAAWNRFYAEYRPIVERTVVQARIPRAERDDASQEIWGELTLSLPRLRLDERRGRLQNWVVTVVRRRVGKCRKKRRFSQTSDHLYYITDHPCKSSDDPAIAAARSEMRQAVRGALVVLATQISPTNWQVLCLRGLEGRSTAEVAEQLSLTPDQVIARHHRLRLRLRRCEPLRRLLDTR